MKTPKSFVRRTQQRDYIETFYTKTCDDKNIALDVYESEQWGKWFVLLMHGYMGWTYGAKEAFGIFNSVSCYTLIELKQELDRTQQ